MEKDWNKITAISSLILALATIIAIFISIISISDSHSLNQKVIDMTPSKYAHIDFVLAYYTGNIDYDAFMNIKNRNFTQVGFNIINTGQLNTGQVQIAKIDELNSDTTFSLDVVNIPDIASKTNNLSMLTFNVKNYSNILGLHQINLSVFCINCLEQGFATIHPIYICIYNESKYPYHEGWINITSRNCRD